MFWLGPAKMKKPLSAFKVFLLHFAFQRHLLLLVERAALAAVGTSDLLLLRDTNWEDRELFPGRGEMWADMSRTGPVDWLVQAWSHAENLTTTGTPQVGRRNGGCISHGLTGLHFKYTKSLLFHVVIFAFNFLLN